MQELPDKKALSFAKSLQKNLDALVQPLVWLDTHLAPFRQGLDKETEALIIWAWRGSQSRSIILNSRCDFGSLNAKSSSPVVITRKAELKGLGKCRRFNM